MLIKFDGWIMFLKYNNIEETTIKLPLISDFAKHD